MDEVQSGSLAEWRTVSLVTCLRQSLLDRVSLPWEADSPAPDSARLLEVVDELTARGIDGDSLVRFGLVPEIMLRHIFTLVLEDLFPIHEDSPSVDSGWRSVFQLDHPTVKRQIQRFPQDADAVYESIQGLLVGSGGPASIAFARVLSWATDANLAVLIQSTPPSQEEVARTSLLPPDLETVKAYRWIVDRFSSTYYAEWATESLHSEWRWQRGLGAPPCPVEQTLEPPMRLHAIEHQIASRAVLDSPKASPVAAAPLAYQVTPHARALLQDGKAEQAAALFEFACKRDPDSPDLRNNLGFCLIPSAPRVALGHLDAARRLGYQPLAINVYNKMCCYVSMRRPALAVREAEKYLSDHSGDDAAPAIVWSMNEGRGYELVRTTDVHDELRALAALAQTLHERRFPEDPSVHSAQ